MASTRDDSVLTSIQEIQRLEDERVREAARKSAEAERARIEKLEAARAESERQAAERVAAIESERAAEQVARASRERADREAREAREMQLRADAERERELRAEERREAHARAMAEIESKGRAGVGAGALVALVLAALSLTAVVGYFVAYRPLVAAQGARIAELRVRAERADQEREAARIAQERLAARIHDLASRPSPAPVVPVAAPQTRTGVPVAARHDRPTTSRNTQTQAPIDIDGEGVDPFAMDDGARPTAPRRPRR